MGVCDKRHFLLTICVLQIIVTTERQVFDFLGYMWVPILVNLFNIIFVILGFFGAFQYRPKYIISYCVWNVIWLSWNVFLICFYLNVGGLDKDSDLLNLGTGSFSWWLINGPGCHEHPNKTVPDQPDVFRPIRPENVTGCFLDYEVIEVIHSSVQCFLAVMAIIGGICLSRVFLEEDDSFDFVGGGDFGTAGHTPLHPMYVSYSALPAAYGKQSAAGSEGYYYPTNTATTSGSHRSSSSTLISPPTPAIANVNENPGQAQKKAPPPQPSLGSLAAANRARAVVAALQLQQQQQHQYVGPGSPNNSFRRRLDDRQTTTPTIFECANYSSPLDEIPPLTEHRAQQQQNLADYYDSLESHTPNLSLNRQLQQQQQQQQQQLQRQTPSPLPPVTYSPLMRARQYNRATNRQNRNSYRPRVYADHIREHVPQQQQQQQLQTQQHQPAPPLPPPQRQLRSFHSDPRLAAPVDDEQRLNGPPAVRRDETRDRNGRRDNSRPVSMFVHNY